MGPVSVLAEPCGSVTGALHASLNHICGHRLAMANQSQKCHQVNEQRRGVQCPPVLTRRVVRREDVVVVVKPLATSAERHANIFPRVNTPVVGSIAPQVRHTVDSPRYIENGNIAQDSACEEGRPCTLGPVVDWHDRRKNET